MGTTIYNVLFRQVINDEGDSEYVSSLKSFSSLKSAKNYAKEIVESAFRKYFEDHGVDSEDIEDIRNNVGNDSEEDFTEFKHFTDHSYDYDFRNVEGYYIQNVNNMGETEIILEAVILPTEVED